MQHGERRYRDAQLPVNTRAVDLRAVDPVRGAIRMRSVSPAADRMPDHGEVGIGDPSAQGLDSAGSERQTPEIEATVATAMSPPPEGSGAPTVLAAHDLGKRFGSKVAVENLNLEVHAGEIFGFLGPNGAGKTTTMRMALGLIRPTSGWVEVFGQDVARNGAAVLSKVGPLVETPALYLHLSGRDNLRVFAAPLGGVPGGRIDSLLELVDLRDRQRDKVRTYSLGMRQRLGLAIALLHDPELLVLDEPANGLDPAGIKAIRSLLRGLRDSGKTVFISSHVLGEVERLCDRVAILRQGKLVQVGRIADFRDSTGPFLVDVEDAQGALDLLNCQPWGKNARLDTQGRIVTEAPAGRGRDLNSMLSQAGFVPDGIARQQRDLEEIFLELTGDGQ
ncbi:MAG TPA: ABC transporter ATP-binding protein [Candidatus Dormibacteraeota bacterium]|nr:ABC transporter ATP-binding protein [Candidatus Dormibacteraeota bacterium]